MKNLKNIIQERLHITKDTKSDYNLINSSLDDFRDLIKEKLDYDLTYEDFRNLRNGFLPNNKKVVEAKFTDVTDDDKEWFAYVPIAKHSTEQLRRYYIIKELDNGYIFDYINTRINVYNEYGKYRIGYVLDNIENRANRDMIKIFKINF